MEMHYIYRHVRLDTNEVFYIGMGTKKKRSYFKIHASEYNRAYSHIGRNVFWKRVVNKTLHKVDIMYESNDYDDIQNKEREFVKLYGRRDLGLGTLVNLTDGGEGQTNATVSETTRKKMSESGIKRFADMLKRRKTSVYIYNLEGEFIKKEESIPLAAIFTGVSRSNIYLVLNEKYKQTSGFVFHKEYMGDKIQKNNRGIRRKVLQINKITKQIIATHDSARAASRTTNIGHKNISRVCAGLKKSTGGYIWKFAE